MTTQTHNTGPDINPVFAFGNWISQAPRDWPKEAEHSAFREFIDTIAVILPGTKEGATLNAMKTVSHWGTGPITAVGFNEGLPTPWAALINGTSGHALDLDDNFDPPKAHASTVLVPAILALGEELGASGSDCIDAYIVGLQILGRVGQGLNPAHRNRGWHATATVGSVGAAGACARLLKLGAQKSAMAISLSTSMAAGFMSQFGTQAKPLHAGLAARNGIMAASFAKNDMTAGIETLDGRTGMNRLMVGPDYEELRDTITHIEHGQNLRFETQNIGEPLLILEHGFRVKRFANCGAAHRAMDAMLYLREKHGFTADDVEKVDVFAPRVHFNNLMYERPENGLQSKFSIEHALAICLAQGTCGLNDFEDEAVARKDVQAIIPRIIRNPVDKLEGEFATYIDVTLNDGRTFREERAWPLGSKWAPFSDDEYWGKFETCARDVLPAQKTAEIRTILSEFPTLPNIQELMAVLRWQQ